MSFLSTQFMQRAASLAVSFCAVNAIAQTQHHPAAMPDAKPMAAATVAPSVGSGLRYESVFSRYKSYRDEKTGSWLGANETVERVGGWRAYAKEAQQPDAAAPAAPARAAAPAAPAKPDPHAGHGRKP